MRRKEIDADTVLAWALEYAIEHNCRTEADNCAKERR